MGRPTQGPAHEFVGQIALFSLLLCSFFSSKGLQGTIRQLVRLCITSVGYWHVILTFIGYITFFPSFFGVWCPFSRSCFVHSNCKVSFDSPFVSTSRKAQPASAWGQIAFYIVMILIYSTRNLLLFKY